MMIDACPEFKPGDPKPEGYLQRTQWAEVQLRAGLRQKRCGFCSFWFFPQELSGEEIRTQATTSRGLKINLIVRICKQCAELRKP